MKIRIGDNRCLVMPHTIRPTSFWPLSGVRVLLLGLCLGAVAVLDCSTALGQGTPAQSKVNVGGGPSIRIHTPDGPVELARFLCDSLDLSGNHRLQKSMRLDFDSTVYMSRSAVPVTIAAFGTGEVLPGHWRLTDRGAGTPELEFAIFGERQQMGAASPVGGEFARPMFKETVRVSLDGLSCIRLPLGCADSSPMPADLSPDHSWRVDESRPVSISDSVSPTEQKYWRCQIIQLPQPVETGLLSFGVKWPTPSEDASANRDSEFLTLARNATVRLLFRNDDALIRTLEVSVLGRRISVQFPNGRSRHFRLRRPPSSYSLIRATLNGGLALSYEDALIAHLDVSPGQLFALEAEGAFAVDGDTNAHSDSRSALELPWVRNVDRSAIEPGNGESPVRHTFDEDRVVLTSGDELFGRVTEFNQSVKLRSVRDGGQVRRIRSADVRAVTFRRSNESEFRTVDGFFSRIELVPDSSCNLAGVEEPFWMRTAIVNAGNVGLLTAHPILGEVFVRWSMIRRIRPLFQGSYTLIDPGPRHLGNGLRESFSRVEPDGVELPFKFEVTGLQLKLPVVFSCDVAELIPSGPGTLKATPWLGDVRAGFLGTQVVLNGELIGTLNELISVGAPVTEPERVRLRLPARLLKEGENSIRLKQTPSRTDPDSFDDCEIRAIAIEFESVADQGPG